MAQPKTHPNFIDCEDFDKWREYTNKNNFLYLKKIFSMKIIKGFNFRFKIANLDTGKDWRVQIYAGKASYDVRTEWQGTELVCTLSAEVTDTMSVGYYNLLIFEGENTIPPKCNVFEVIDVKNGGC